MEKKQLLIPAACLLAGFALGFGVEKILAREEAQVEWAERTKKLESRFLETNNVFPSPLAGVIRLDGYIKAVNGQTLTVTLNSPKDPFGDSSLDERLVDVDDHTQITMSVPKDGEVYKKESQVYQKKLAEWKTQFEKNGTRPTGDVAEPSVFELKTAVFSDLRVGSAIVITTAEDVKDKKNFTAHTILVTGSSSPPPAEAREDTSHTSFQTPGDNATPASPVPPPASAVGANTPTPSVAPAPPPAGTNTASSPPTASAPAPVP